MVELSKPPAPKRALPFKRTVFKKEPAPKKVEDASEKQGDKSADPEDDEDDSLSLFTRPKDWDSFEKHLVKQESGHKRKQPDRKSVASDKKPEVTSPIRPKGESPSQTIRSPSHGLNSRTRIRSPTPKDDGSEEFVTPPSKRSRTTSRDLGGAQLEIRSTPQSHHAITAGNAATGAQMKESPSRQPSFPASTQETITIEDSDEDVFGVDDDLDIYTSSPSKKTPSVKSKQKAPESPSRTNNHASTSLAIGEGNDEDEGLPGDLAHYVREARERMRQQTQEQEKDSTRIDILVTSDIPNAPPKQFRFTLWKPMSVVRNAWCQTAGCEAGLSTSELRGVFFTWRGHRIYDSTTLNSLDIKRMQSGMRADDDSLPAWTKVHMQAWTETLWDEYEKKKERARLRELGELDELSGDEDENENDDIKIQTLSSSASGTLGAKPGGSNDAAQQSEEQGKKIRVILKTRSDPPVKTSVRRTTSVADLVAYYRQQRNVAENVEIALLFDGEQLGGDMTVEDADIEDMDTIEVHLRG